MLSAGRAGESYRFAGSPGLDLKFHEKELVNGFYSIPIWLHQKENSLASIVYDLDKQKVINLPNEINTEEIRHSLSGYIQCLFDHEKQDQ